MRVRANLRSERGQGEAEVRMGNPLALLVRVRVRVRARVRVRVRDRARVRVSVRVRDRVTARVRVRAKLPTPSRDSRVGGRRPDAIGGAWLLLGRCGVLLGPQGEPVEPAELGEIELGLGIGLG